MVIRDDRGWESDGPPPVPLLPPPAPDRVLFNCPECGRSHFVTVDACPAVEVAVRETAMALRRVAG